MRTIVTDDAGLEAARLACPSTSEVTEFTLAGVAALLVRAPWITSHADVVASLRSIPGAERVVVIFLDAGVGLESVDEVEMRRAGWTRAPRRRA